MAYKLVTCPETAHLEMLELHRHPLGVLIDACSRFRPAERIDCPRTCAARLDRKERACHEACANSERTAVSSPPTVMLVRSLLRSGR